jgi:hypothetical protein
MTKLTKILETNENEQDLKDFTVIMPPYVVAFGVQALTALLADYDYYNDEAKQSNAKSAIELLSYLTPHLNEIYKL